MSTLLMALLLLQSTGDPRAALAPGRAVYVEPTKEEGAAPALGAALAEWGRWRVVEVAADADLIIRTEAKGSAFMARKTARAVIHDARTDAPLWTSRPAAQRRSSVFTGYQSPHEVAAKRLVEQMREASNTWPARQ